jgi:hypothetical protein
VKKKVAKKKKSDIDLMFTADMLKLWDNNQKISKRARAKIVKEAQDTARHFQGADWDLSYGSLMSDLFAILHGYNPEWLYLLTVVEELGRPLYLHGNKGTVLSLSPEKPRRQREDKSIVRTTLKGPRK